MDQERKSAEGNASLGRGPTLTKMVLQALWGWSRTNPRWIPLLLRIAWRLWHTNRRRARSERRLYAPVLSAVALSPTMRCNYNCRGCYSRGRSTHNELSTGEVDKLFTEAEELGVPLFVITGGEPLMRGDVLHLITSHRRLLFIFIANGSLMTPEIARRMARSGTVVPLVSIEGSQGSTDDRRRPNAHGTAIRALELLRDVRATFGFSAMATTANFDDLITEKFVDQMIGLGCAIGFFIEYVPCDATPRSDWALDEETRELCRERVLDLRRRKPIVLSQFPHDEYGAANQCAGAGRKTLHINAQGDVEPCPFVSLSGGNIRQGGLPAACQSPLFRAIRERPSLLKRHKYGCSLFEHRAEVDAPAREFDVHNDEKLIGSSTDRSGHSGQDLRWVRPWPEVGNAKRGWSERFTRGSDGSRQIPSS